MSLNWDHYFSFINLLDRHLPLRIYVNINIKHPLHPASRESNTLLIRNLKPFIPTIVRILNLLSIPIPISIQIPIPKQTNPPLPLPFIPPLQIPQILRIHSKYIIKPFEIPTLNLPRRMPIVCNPVLPQRSQSTGIWLRACMVGACSGRISGYGW